MNLASEELTSILAKLQRGDEEAFSFFYKYFFNDMYAYGRSLGAEEDFVFDAIQDVFLKFFFKRSQWKSVDHLKFSLLKSLKNRLYDVYKCNPSFNTTKHQEDFFSFSIKTTVLDEIIEEEDRRVIQQKVEKLLNSLSPLQKETVYLRYILELEYSQISEILQKNEAAVRKIVSQAINKIRKENTTLPLITFIFLFFKNFQPHI